MAYTDTYYYNEDEFYADYHSYNTVNYGKDFRDFGKLFVMIMYLVFFYNTVLYITHVFTSNNEDELKKKIRTL